MKIEDRGSRDKERELQVDPPSSILDPQSLSVLVTGATGFLGSHLVEALVARGDRVRALVRPGRDLVRLQELNVECVPGNLEDSESLRRAVAGVEIVYHMAAVTGVLPHTYADLFAPNVQGTENLLLAAAEAGVRRFVFMSSLQVYGFAHNYNAEDAPQLDQTPYGLSKIDAENAVRRVARARHMEYTILRPTGIYGPRDWVTVRALRILPWIPLLPLPYEGEMPIDLVHVKDVVQATVLAGTRPQAVGEAFNIGSGMPMLVREMAAFYRRTTGRGPVILPLPDAFVSTLLATLRRTVPWANTELWTPERLHQGLVVDIRKAERLLGYKPEIDLPTGLLDTLSAEHLLPAESGPRSPKGCEALIDILPWALGALVVLLFARRGRRRVSSSKNSS